jgi:hypothetical protein
MKAPLSRLANGRLAPLVVLLAYTSMCIWTSTEQTANPVLPFPTSKLHTLPGCCFGAVHDTQFVGFLPYSKVSLSWRLFLSVGWSLASRWRSVTPWAAFSATPPHFSSTCFTTHDPPGTVCNVPTEVCHYVVPFVPSGPRVVRCAKQCETVSPVPVISVVRSTGVPLSHNTQGVDTLTH